MTTQTISDLLVLPSSSKGWLCWLSTEKIDTAFVGDKRGLAWTNRTLGEAAVEEAGLMSGERWVKRGQCWAVRCLDLETRAMFTVTVEAKSQDHFEAVAVAQYRPKQVAKALLAQILV